MRYICTIILLISTLLSCFGGGGLTYRYKVRLKTEDSNTLIDGYFYYGTFNDGYIKGQESFLDFILKNTKDTLAVYPDIKSIKNEKFTTDFVLKNTKISLHKNDILDIELLDVFSYPLGDGMDYVSKSEFDIISDNPVSIDYYHDGIIGENCGYVFIGFDNNNKMFELRKEFIQEIENLNSTNKSYKIKHYFNTFKTQTVQDNVLLILSCGMM